MFDRCFARPHVPRRLRANPLGEDIERLAVYLLDRGHTPDTIKGYIRAAEHFGRWVGRKGIRTDAVDREVIARFLDRHLRHCRCPSPSPRHSVTMRATLRHLLRLVEGRKKAPVPSGKLAPIEAILQNFDLHMRVTCSLAPATRHYRLRYTRQFLQGIFGCGPLRFDRLGARDPIAFITAYARRCSPGTAQVAASALRGFFRFLRLRGQCDSRLM